MFSGTLRENLSPSSDSEDDTVLLDALRRVGLLDSDDGKNVSPVFLEGLDTPIPSGGRSLSHGQRQLVCLARTLVAQRRTTPPRVLILDEATSAVDSAADAALQRATPTAFAGTTLVVVAHRLSTVADFDRVLVLRDGAPVEFGAPRDLAAARGLFWDMVCASPEKDALLSILGAS
jgi:ABC-type multidrug transport system fused ATPase/permease subunit